LAQKIGREPMVLKDTHDDHYLSSCAPDLTIVREGRVPSAFSAHALIELQVMKSLVNQAWVWAFLIN
jgi:hypothetical protein